AQPGYARSTFFGAIAALCVVIVLICAMFTLMHNASSRADVSKPDAKMPHLEGLLVAMPQDPRQKTVLTVAAGSPDVTVQRYFDVTNHLARLVDKYGLAYVSQTGIK